LAIAYQLIEVMITAIIGPPGIGKTYWIQKQIAKAKGNLRYFSPQTESNPIDATLIQSEFPNIQILSSEQELNNFDEKETITYMEIPWYLNLLKIEPLLQQLNCHRVAIMPPRSQNTGWHAWADEIIMGNSLEEEQLAEISPNNPLEIHRGILTGEILDFKSLEVFWSELIEDAYGNIARVKGIFEIMDGQSIYGEFLHNLPQKDFEPLNLPRWYKGKPQRFSGFEIMGQNLDKEQIAQTVKQCCLPEQAINYYQQQIQSSLPKEELLL
jgi:hypothetical protein